MALTEITSKGIKDADIATADLADDAITQAKIADDAVGLAQMAAGTDGQIITYDASGNPTAVGPGTDGQVLTSTGAGSPPAFEDLPASGPSLANDANNRVITGTGSGLNGEANLTFDGSTLEVKSSAATTNDLINSINVNARTTGTAAAGVGTKMTFWGSMTGQDDVELGQIGFHNTNVSGAHGDFVVKTRPNGTSAERLRITSSGDVKINTGNLVIGTSGKGIDFSAHADVASGETTTSSVLDDYEEGTFTAKMGASTNYDTYEVTGLGNYIKIGTMVTVNFRFHNVNLNNSASGTIYLFNMPFTGNNFSATNSKAGTSADWNGYNISFNTDYQYAFYIEPSTNTWQGRGSRNGTTWIDWTVDNFISSNTYLDFTGSYRVA